MFTRIIDVYYYLYNTHTIEEAEQAGREASVSKGIAIHYENMSYTVSAEEEEVVKKVCEAIVRKIEQKGGNAR